MRTIYPCLCLIYLIVKLRKISKPTFFLLIMHQIFFMKCVSIKVATINFLFIVYYLDGERKVI